MKNILFFMVLFTTSINAFSQQLCPSNDSVLSDAYAQNADNINPRTGVTVSAEMLSDLVINKCYGDLKDQDPFTRQLLQQMADARNESTNLLVFKKIVEGMLVDLINYADQQARMAKMAETSQVWASYINQLNLVLTSRDSSKVDFIVNRDDLRSNLLQSYDGLGVVSRHCPNVWQGTVCIQAVKETGKLFRGLVLAQEVISVANLSQLNTQLGFVKGRLEGFKNYYEKAEPLWPWESLFNTNIVTANDEIRDGNLIGFRDPVEYQLLVFHPSTALQYVANQDAKFKPSVIVDILGYNKLDWNDSGSDLSSYGASAIVSLSEFEGETNLGWGIRFFYNKKYSFGITKNNDQVGLFISIGAIEKFNGWETEKNKFIDNYNSVRAQF